jgi:hypothetical protein
MSSNHNKNTNTDLEVLRNLIKQQITLSSRFREYGLALTRAGGEWLCLCPFHDDHKPSLAINDTKGVYTCRSCKASGDVLTFEAAPEGGAAGDFLGAIERLAPLVGHTFVRGHVPRRRSVEPPASNCCPPIRPNERPKPVALLPVPEMAPPLLRHGRGFSGLSRGGKPRTALILNPKVGSNTAATWSPDKIHTYKNAEGDLLGYVLRAKLDNGQKITPTVIYADGIITDDNAEPQTGWCVGKFPNPLPIYRLDRVSEAVAEGSIRGVVICEGEKDADVGELLTAAGLITVTWPNGAGNADHADWESLVRVIGTDLRVTIFPDDDPYGLTAAEEIVTKLADLGVRDVHQVDVAWADRRNEGWSISDAVDKNRGRRRRDDLIEIVRSAPKVGGQGQGLARLPYQALPRQLRQFCFGEQLPPAALLPDLPYGHQYASAAEAAAAGFTGQVVTLEPLVAQQMLREFYEDFFSHAADRDVQARPSMKVFRGTCGIGKTAGLAESLFKFSDGDLGFPALKIKTDDDGNEIKEAVRGLFFVAAPSTNLAVSTLNKLQVSFGYRVRLRTGRTAAERDLDGNPVKRDPRDNGEKTVWNLENLRNSREERKTRGGSDEERMVMNCRLSDVITTLYERHEGKNARALCSSRVSMPRTAAAETLREIAAERAVTWGVEIDPETGDELQITPDVIEAQIEQALGTGDENEVIPVTIRCPHFGRCGYHKQLNELQALATAGEIDGIVGAHAYLQHGLNGLPIGLVICDESPFSGMTAEGWAYLGAQSGQAHMTATYLRAEWSADDLVRESFRASFDADTANADVRNSLASMMTAIADAAIADSKIDDIWIDDIIRGNLTGLMLAGMERFGCVWPQLNKVIATEIQNRQNTDAHTAHQLMADIFGVMATNDPETATAFDQAHGGSASALRHAARQMGLDRTSAGNIKRLIGDSPYVMARSALQMARAAAASTAGAKVRLNPGMGCGQNEDANAEDYNFIRSLITAANREIARLENAGNAWGEWRLWDAMLFQLDRLESGTCPANWHNVSVRLCEGQAKDIHGGLHPFHFYRTSYRKHFHTALLTAPWLILDATADAEIAKPFFRESHEFRGTFELNVRENASHVLVSERSFADSALLAKDDELRNKTLEAIKTLASRPNSSGTAVFSTKQVEAEIFNPCGAGSIQATIKTGHYNAVTGLDDWMTCDNFVGLGRQQPTTSAVDSIAAALFWDSPTPPARLGKDFDRQDGYFEIEGGGWIKRPKCVIPADPYVRRVLWQCREAPYIQATIGRSRAVWRAAANRALTYHLAALPLVPAVYSRATTLEAITDGTTGNYLSRVLEKNGGWLPTGSPKLQAAIGICDDNKGLRDWCKRNGLAAEGLTAMVGQDLVYDHPMDIDIGVFTVQLVGQRQRETHVIFDLSCGRAAIKAMRTALAAADLQLCKLQWTATIRSSSAVRCRPTIPVPFALPPVSTAIPPSSNDDDAMPMIPPPTVVAIGNTMAVVAIAEEPADAIWEAAQDSAELRKLILGNGTRPRYVTEALLHEIPAETVAIRSMMATLDKMAAEIVRNPSKHLPQAEPISESDNWFTYSVPRREQLVAYELPWSVVEKALKQECLELFGMA